MASAAVLLLTAFLLSSSAAVDVMEILRPEPDFSVFTEFLDKTKVAQDISSLHTATVLALDNDAMAAVTSLPPAVARELLSLHVILDYYDPDTLDRDFKKDKTAILPTLLQVTGHGGVSVDSFLNYTERADQSMYFGSTAPGAAHDSELIKVVGARPYDLSVLHISKAILSPSIVRGRTGAPSSVPAADPVVVDGDGSSVVQGPVASSGDSEVSGIAASPEASTPAQAPASAAERVMVGAALGLAVAVAVAVGL